VDGALLMEVMETREAIEDAGTHEGELRQLLAENDVKEAACVAALGAALDGEEGGSEGGGGLQTARRAAVKLTYLARIRTEIQDRL